MKLYTGLLLMLFITGSLFGQKSAPAVTRYYEFTGTIDKYPVTFHLHRTNAEFGGSYYYQSTERPMNIFGQLDSTGVLKLSHYSNDESNNESIQGSFNDSVFTGTWFSKGKRLDLRLTLKKDTSKLKFDYIWTHGEKKIKFKDEWRAHFSGLTYEAASVWPTANATHRSTVAIQQVIRLFFGEKTSKEAIGKIMLKQKNKLLNTPVDSIEVYESGESVQIEYRSARLLGLAHHWGVFTGGAHGMNGTSYTNLDLLHNRVINLSDVLDTLAARESMQKILELAFRKYYKMESSEKLEDVLLVPTIDMTENFLLTGKGINFSYGPYDIAPYALGSVFLYVPYTDVQRWLKPSFKKLMGL